VTPPRGKEKYLSKENVITMKAAVGQTGEDPVSNVLKWILLAVAIATFGLLGWTTVVTYQTAPPSPTGLSPRAAPF
jgi:hypothetical protein